MKVPKHRITIRAGAVTVRGVLQYQIGQSLTEGVDTFSISVPFSPEAWAALAPDRVVQIAIDGVAVLTGWIDDSDASDDGTTITFNGRNRCGRLVHDAAAGVSFAGLPIRDQVAKLAAPWFAKVTLDNSRNRTAIRGRGQKARVAREPRGTNRRAATRVEPGQTRWTVITELCEQRGLLVWSSGDGTELVLGEPNYAQEPQFRLFRPRPGSARASSSTVLAMTVRRSTGDRFSRVIVVGSGTGTDANYGAKVASRYGEAKNNPATRDGEGLDFTAPKRLVLQRTVSSADEAAELAAAEMSRRDGAARTITVRAEGHGQYLGARPTLFACDTLAALEDEITGTRGVYLITALEFSGSRDQGEETSITLVPKGTELSR